jgi:hypothetical protein
MVNNMIPITYAIKFEKDHASVKATYNLGVPVGSAALIADFQISVDGTDLISGFVPGQTGFNGARFHILSRPDENAPVSFSMSSSQGWTAADKDVLRGEKAFDDSDFSN